MLYIIYIGYITSYNDDIGVDTNIKITNYN